MTPKQRLEARGIIVNNIYHTLTLNIPKAERLKKITEIIELWEVVVIKIELLTIQGIINLDE